MTAGKLSLLLATAALLACGPVTKHAERVGFGPGPYIPSSAGSPMRAGQLRFAGEMNSLAVVGPETSSDCGPDAPGLWLPKYQVGGSFHGAISDLVTLGLFARFARLDWAEPCNECVKRFEDHDGDKLAWSIGLDSRVNLPIDDPGFVSIAVELGAMSFSEEISKTSDVETPLHFGLFLIGGARLGQGFSLYGLAGVEALRTNLMNETWEDDPSTYGDDADDNFGYATLPLGVGLEYRYENLFVNAVAYYPISTNPGIDYGPSLSAQLGFDLF